MRQLLFLDPGDNVAVSLVDLSPGSDVDQDGRKFQVIDMIPRGHKIATRSIAKGDAIIKYGERMGHATKDIQVGEHVHIHNILGDRLSTEKSI